MTEAQPLMSVRDLCAFLGGIPEQTVYQWRHHGKGPRSIKVGRHVRYLVSDVDTWLAAQADRPAAA